MFKFNKIIRMIPYEYVHNTLLMYFVIVCEVSYCVLFDEFDYFKVRCSSL